MRFLDGETKSISESNLFMNASSSVDSGVISSNRVYHRIPHIGNIPVKFSCKFSNFRKDRSSFYVSVNDIFTDEAKGIDMIKLFAVTLELL